MNRQSILFLIKIIQLNSNNIEINKNIILNNYINGNLSENEAISKLIKMGLSNKAVYNYLGIDNIAETEHLNTYEIQCEGIVWNLRDTEDYDEDDEENISIKDFDLPKNTVIYINANSENEAEEKIADKLLEEYDCDINYIQIYNIQKVNSISNIKSKIDKSGNISYNSFLEWLYTMPKEWKKFLRYFEEDEDIDIEHVGVDPQDAKDYISEQNELYDKFIIKFGNKEIVYD